MKCSKNIQTTRSWRFRAVYEVKKSRLPCRVREVMLGCPIRFQIAMAGGRMYILYIREPTCTQHNFFCGGGGHCALFMNTLKLFRKLLKNFPYVGHRFPITSDKRIMVFTASNLKPNSHNSRVP